MAAYPHAVQWLLAARDYQIDPVTGRHVAAHPVDAAVTIRLGFRRGTISGDPTTGHTYHDVSLGDPADVRQRDVERRTTDALGNLLTDGLIELKRVAHEVDPIVGRLSVLVEYTNLRTGRAGQVAF